MSRLPRHIIAPPTGIFHVINRGNNRNAIFHDEQDFLAMRSEISKCIKRFGFSVLHYVLMTNHYHLLLEILSQGEMSDIMKTINQAYAIHHKKKYGNVGRLWQDRFKSYVVDTDAYLSACGIYIELNPVRAKMVAVPEDYEWSSYRAYAYGAEDLLVKQDIWYVGLGNSDEERRGAYRQLVRMWQSIGQSNTKFSAGTVPTHA